MTFVVRCDLLRELEPGEWDEIVAEGEAVLAEQHAVYNDIVARGLGLR